MLTSGPVRLLRLAPLAAALLAAGCAGAGIEDMVPHGPAVLEAADLRSPGVDGAARPGDPWISDSWDGFAFGEMPLQECTLFGGGLGQGLGVAVALVAPRDEDRDWLEDGYYIHVRYLYELSLYMAWEFDTGIYKADNKLAGVVPGQEDVESMPLRFTVQMCTDVPEGTFRLYLYGGAGYFLYDSDLVDDEWGVHFGLGAEFGDLGTNMGSRLEVGHLRLTDSGINQWTGALVLYYKF